MSKEVECPQCSLLFANLDAFDAHQHLVCNPDMAQFQRVEYPNRAVYRLRKPDEPAVVKELSW